VIETWRGQLPAVVALLSLAISLAAAVVFDRQYEETSLLTLTTGWPDGCKHSGKT